jgi:hypothetical protein
MALMDAFMLSSLGKEVVTAVIIMQKYFQIVGTFVDI